jgi:hypothetical protein
MGHEFVHTEIAVNIKQFLNTKYKRARNLVQTNFLLRNINSLKIRILYVHALMTTGSLADHWQAFLHA